MNDLIDEAKDLIVRTHARFVAEVILRPVIELHIKKWWKADTKKLSFSLSTYLSSITWTQVQFPCEECDGGDLVNLVVTSSRLVQVPNLGTRCQYWGE
jgi:hypothetical protein